MSASVTDNKRSLRKNTVVWIGITAFCGIFSTVYEHFSHGVFSPFMVWLFAIPLLGAALPYAVLSLPPIEKSPGRFIRNIYNSGIATLCVGSCMRGVTDIYGTSTIYESVYWIVGLFFIFVGIVAFILKPAESRHRYHTRAS